MPSTQKKLSKNMLLSVNNLSTHFKAGPGKIARAVDGVSFDLNQGKTLALVAEKPKLHFQLSV